MVDLSGLEGLTGRGGDINAKVDYLRNILPDYIDEGYSYAGALRDLRDNDFSISTNLFYLVRRQIEGLDSNPNSIRNLPGDYYPSADNLGVNPDKQDRDFKFIYRAQVYDESGEYLYSQNFSMQMDSFGSIAELRELGKQYLAEKYPHMEGEKTQVELYYGLRKN